MSDNNLQNEGIGAGLTKEEKKEQKRKEKEEKKEQKRLASLGGDEVDLLKDFETRITDKNCLAYQWYYEKLPLKIVKEVSEAIVHKY